MSQNQYSFTKTIATAIPFDIPDKDGNALNFIFRLPSANDFAPVQEANAEKEVLQAKLDKADEAEAEEIKAKMAELDKVSEDLIRELITPVGHQVSFEDAMKQTPVSVARAVNEMLIKEMGGEDK